MDTVHPPVMLRAEKAAAGEWSARSPLAIRLHLDGTPPATSSVSDQTVSCPNVIRHPSSGVGMSCMVMV